MTSATVTDSTPNSRNIGLPIIRTRATPSTSGPRAATSGITTDCRAGGDPRLTAGGSGVIGRGRADPGPRTRPRAVRPTGSGLRPSHRRPVSRGPSWTCSPVGASRRRIGRDGAEGSSSSSRAPPRPVLNPPSPRGTRRPASGPCSVTTASSGPRAGALPTRSAYVTLRGPAAHRCSDRAGKRSRTARSCSSASAGKCSTRHVSGAAPPRIRTLQAIPAPPS